jgi:putative membrane protein
MKQLKRKKSNLMKNPKKILTLYLMIMMLLSPALLPVYGQTLAEKEEVVYGLLNYDGEVDSLYVVNRFTNGALQGAGGRITDYGSYTEVRNMTTSETIQVDGDEITIDTTAEQFFYQGILEDTDLPWSVSLRYRLNGEEILPGDLAGQRGNFEIIVEITENPRVTAEFFENYLLQVSFTMDTEYFPAIESPGGVLASAGRNRIITHTVMPGEEARIFVGGSTDAFKMEAIEFSALPFSMAFEVPAADNFIDEADTLSEAVSGLHEGISSLNSGIGELSDGASSLNTGAGEFGRGLTEINDNSEELLSASRQIRGGLDQVVTQVSEQQDLSTQIEELSELSQGLRELAAGLGEMAGGMDQLSEGYSLAYQALDTAITAIPEGEVDPAPLYGALQGNEALSGTLNQLVEFYASAKRVQGTYQEVAEVFQTVTPTLQTFSESLSTTQGALREMADGIDGFLPPGSEENPLQEFIDGMTELSENYHRFHYGLYQYFEGLEELSAGYQEISGGLSSLSGGLNDLEAGAEELEEGSSELSRGVSDLPSIIQEEMEKAEGLYDTSDFEPVSFVSEKNTAVASVQFVFRTPPIEVPEEAPLELDEGENLSFWQRFLKLFRFNND